jgi:uncharacterized RDD family membrane protein YckC
VDLPLRAPAGEAPLADLELKDGAPGAASVEPSHERAAAGFGRPAPRRAAPLPSPPLPSPPPADSAVAPLGAEQAPPAAEDAAEDLPLFAPRPAGTPLAVRRPGHEVPKARRTTTRPLRQETPALPLVPEPAEEAEVEPARAARHRAPELAGIGGRLAAAAIDLALLLAIDLAVVWLTLRLSGLSPTREDLAVIRPIPMAGFLFVMAFLYLTAFTVGGGQTIGKMVTGIRVAGDDGRGVDITGAVVRALGCMAAVATIGLLFLPAVFGADRRAIHDRLAGTRVVVG